MTGPKIVAEVLERFDLTVNELGEILLVGERTVRRWSSGEQELSPLAELVLVMLLVDMIEIDDLSGMSVNVRQSRTNRDAGIPTVPLARKQRKEERRRSR